MADQELSDPIHIDGCGAHLGGRCNCGKLLAALADPNPTPPAASAPNRRGVLLLIALAVGIVVIWASV